MNRTVFFRFASSLVLFTSALFAGSAWAQGNGHGGGNPPPPPPPPPLLYRLEYGNIPAGTTSMLVNKLVEATDGTYTGQFVTGLYGLSGNNHGFVYDHLAGIFTDVHALLGLDQSWSSSCSAINASGVVVGYVSNGASRRAFWFDLFSPTPAIHYLDQQFPALAAYSHHPVGINANGDVLIRTIVPAPPYTHFVVNPFSNGGLGELILLNMFFDVRGINDSRVVIGEDTASNSVRRDTVNNVTQTFPGMKFPQGINASGKFCGYTEVLSGKPKRLKKYAFRYGNLLEWTSSPIEVNSSGARSLNDEGDVAFLTTDGNIPWFYHSTLGQSIELRTLVVDAFFDGGVSFSHTLTNRDQSLSQPAPVISGIVLGANGERRLFFLFPEEP